MTIKPGKIIQDLIDVQDRVADFISNGPSGGLPGHVRDQYRKRCDQFANLPPWARALGNGTTGTMNRICQPYWDNGGFDGPTVEVPFPGGQCEGVNYQIGSLGTATCPTSVGDMSVFISGPGPLSLTSQSTIDTGLFPRPLLTTFVITFQDGPRNLAVRHNVGVVPCIRAFRLDGQPDNCGDQPGELEPGPNPPPDPGPTPGPEPTDDPDDPFGIPLLPIPDYDDPLGGPTPIEAPDDPVPPGSPEAGPGSPENIGEPIVVEPTGGEGEETPFGEPPEGRSWVGCLLNFNLPSNLGGIPGSAPANRVIARVFGNGSLVFDGGRGIAERQNSAWSYLIRPTGALKVTGVYVNCEPGITYTVRPISIANCPENLCGD